VSLFSFFLLFFPFLILVLLVRVWPSLFVESGVRNGGKWRVTTTQPLHYALADPCLWRRYGRGRITRGCWRRLAIPHPSAHSRNCLVFFTTQLLFHTCLLSLMIAPRALQMYHKHATPLCPWGWNTWAVSSKERNRKQHSLNGNPRPPRTQPLPVGQWGAFEKQWEHVCLVLNPIPQPTGVSCVEHVFKVLGDNNEAPQVATVTQMTTFFPHVEIWAEHGTFSPNGTTAVVHFARIQRGRGNGFGIVYVLHTTDGRRMPHWMVGPLKNDRGAVVTVPACQGLRDAVYNLMRGGSNVIVASLATSNPQPVNPAIAGPACVICTDPTYYASCTTKCGGKGHPICRPCFKRLQQYAIERARQQNKH
jgi:hypothetical protein